ncbi:hypothetical protein BDZ89DRAFT_1078898 [Hymenopellis radicata]|nr:hypothetical protein BDZ89DRAFT_1078898 [Hymenopellis radicata]
MMRLDDETWLDDGTTTTQTTRQLPSPPSPTSPSSHLHISHYLHHAPPLLPSQLLGDADVA